jgi:hypothetical protein
MKRAMKHETKDGLIKTPFLLMTLVLALCGLICCLWPVTADSETLTGAQEQTLKSPPPDPSGAGTPDQRVSCTFEATPRYVKPGDTIHIRLQTFPPVEGNANFAYLTPSGKTVYVNVKGVQGIYEMDWLLPEDTIANPSISYKINADDPNIYVWCTGGDIFYLTGSPKISHWVVPTLKYLGEETYMRVEAKGTRPLTYRWVIGKTTFTEGPTDEGESAINNYVFDTEGDIPVTITVTNQDGSDERTAIVSVKKKRVSMQFTKQPSTLIAPGYTAEWCIKYSGDSSGGYTLVSSFGDASESKQVYDREGTVCIQHIFQKTGIYDVRFTLDDAIIYQSMVVAGCPPGFEVCGEDCMPAGKGCCDPAPGFCEVKPLCCAGGCCTTSQFCHEGRVCCDIGMVGCPGQAGCCTINQNCCSGGCCDGPCCAGGCCLKGDQCCGEKCCSVGDQCCNGGTHCCPPNKVCTASGCADPQCLPAACCPERPVTCPSTCCSPGQACCGDGCMTAGRTCCGTYSCTSEQACCGSGCMAAGNDCCADGTSCPAGSVCCAGGCCPTSAVCGADGSCCAQGYQSCKDKGGAGCCPAGTECCGGSACCKPGTCDPGTGLCKQGAAQSLQQLQSEGFQRLAPSSQ